MLESTKIFEDSSNVKEYAHSYLSARFKSSVSKRSPSLVGLQLDAEFDRISVNGEQEMDIDVMFSESMELFLCRDEEDIFEEYLKDVHGIEVDDVADALEDLINSPYRELIDREFETECFEFYEEFLNSGVIDEYLRVMSSEMSR